MYKNQLQKIQEGFVCRVCMDKEILIILCFCGYMVCCSECVDRLDECFVCRIAINKIQFVFFFILVMVVNGQLFLYDYGKYLIVIVSCVGGGRDICRINVINIFCDFYFVDFIGKCVYRICLLLYFMLLKIIFVNIEFINFIYYFVINMFLKGVYYVFGVFCLCKDL